MKVRNLAIVLAVAVGAPCATTAEAQEAWPVRFVLGNETIRNDDDQAIGIRLFGELEWLGDVGLDVESLALTSFSVTIDLPGEELLHFTGDCAGGPVTGSSWLVECSAAGSNPVRVVGVASGSAGPIDDSRIFELAFDMPAEPVVLDPPVVILGDDTREASPMDVTVDTVTPTDAVSWATLKSQYRN